MARILMLTLLFVCTTSFAATSLRVGSKVLTIGDSATRVLQLMGEPSLRTLSHAAGDMPNNQLMPREQWQYAQDGKTIVITIVGGRATNFETLYE
jgi:hypothetical protein